MKRKIKITTLGLVKILLAFVIVFPVLIAIVVSFQSLEEIYRLPYRLTMEHPSWDNYIYAFQKMNLFVYLKNTFVQILVRVPCQIITSLLAAYAFSYFEFPMKKTLFAIMIAAMMIPGEAVTITVFKMVVKWQMVDTYMGLSITGLVNVSAAFMFRQAMLSTPISLWEAAKMDGCGRMRYFTRILVPICKSIITAQTILSLIGTYNDYLWPLLVTTRDAMRTVQTGIVYLMGVSNTGYTMAAIIIVLALPIILFVFGLDYIMEGVTAGAVKN